MTELEEFRSMLQLSFHEYTEGPLEDAPDCVVVHVKPDLNDQVTVVFTFDDDGDLSSLYPVFPENWRLTVVGREQDTPESHQAELDAWGRQTMKCQHHFPEEYVFTAWFVVELANGEPWLGTTCENDCGVMLLRNRQDAKKPPPSLKTP